MSPVPKNSLVFQNLTCVLLLALLGACVPAQPEGAGTEGLARIAEQLHARGDDAGAADFYTRAIQRTPADAGIRKSFGQILEAHGDNANADAQYREALQIRPGDADLLRAHGRVLIKLNQPAEARDVYQQALRADPEDVKALNGLGVSLDYLGSHDAAQKIYKEALDGKPGDLATLGNLAHSYVLSGGWDEAITLLEPHLKNQGATPALRQNLAEAYGMAGMDADAERVSRMDLSPAQVRHNLAWYRSHRSHLSRAAGLYADLGNFPTEAMATAHAEDVKARFAEETEGLVVTTAPIVKAADSTPSFVVHVTGFAKAARLHAFCDTLKKETIACMARTEM